LFVRYIDLLRDLRGSVEEMANGFPLRRKQKRVKAPRKVAQSERFTRRRRDYYLNKEYLACFEEADIDELNSLLDEDVARRLGYSLQSI
jgi:hypothetical protein